MSTPAGPVFTIGHSNRQLEGFVEMVRSARADLVVDVRSFPRSRTNPQFNIETLPPAIEVHQIGYDHWPELGGRRKAQGNVAEDANGFWQNRSFHHYADYALTHPFQSALERLIEQARTRRPALMCSEAVWWRCHRRIITDHLLARGVDVLHIMGMEKVVPASMTDGATIVPGGLVEYPTPKFSRPNG